MIRTPLNQLIPLLSFIIFCTQIEKRYKINLRWIYLLYSEFLTIDYIFYSCFFCFYLITDLVVDIANNRFSALINKEYHASSYPFYVFILGYCLFVFPFTYLIPSYPSIFFQNDYIKIYSPVYIAQLLSYIFLICPYLDKFAIYIGNKISS